MNIALLGYGRMGKTIETIALKRGHTISLKKDKETPKTDLSTTDVAIDFSIPTSAVANIKQCIDAGVPVVSGTTGWLESYDLISAYCKANNGGFLYASNFSLGVNIFFEVNRVLASLVSQYPNYNTEIEEIHHTKKLDAPSGTAITLAEDIINKTHYTNWSLNKTNNTTIPIVSKRIEDVPGTHTVNYTSEVDSIEMTHTAHNRKGFALGAVIAAEWIKNKKGVFTMKDVLNIG